MNLIAGVAALLIGWAAFIGYVMNIVLLFNATELSFTAAARITGIVFFPIGCVAGYL